MDEAFVPLSRLVWDMGSPPDDLVDDEAGVHSYVTRFEVESPVELDVRVGEDGRVAIGTSAPLYLVDTSMRPSYHRIHFVAAREGLVE
jgi:hypothetical protein